MPDRPNPELFDELSERAKELTCLYDVEEILTEATADFDATLQTIVERLPAAFRYPTSCGARISLFGMTFTSRPADDPPWIIDAAIITREGRVGSIEVFYTSELAVVGTPFFPEEERLLKTIAQRISDAVQHRDFQHVIKELEQMRGAGAQSARYRWHTIVDLLLRTDQKLYARMARKLMNYMCWNEVPDACEFFAGDDSVFRHAPSAAGENAPQRLIVHPDVLAMSERIFEIAEANLPERTVLGLLQKWLQEDKASFIFRTLINLDHSLADVAEAVRRFIDLNPPNGLEVSEATGKGMQVLLIRRIITNQLEYIAAAKKHVTVRDFYDLIDRMIIPAKSHGVIGGKAAGLFLASRILNAHVDTHPRLAEVGTPKTWYLPSDSLHYFMNYNDMEEMFEQKYKPIEEIRNEYPHIIQLFKNSRFPPDIVQGLSMALDDLGTEPIIVRSSSRLEDRFGAAFSGKYKSLFLANQGSKHERLLALLDAVAEVYSSLFGPDPLQYRVERGLLDVREEMGVIIQQVVGVRIGQYYLPTCAGIAFSSNEFRWSARIMREDGLLRLVPGLGTRAVDRIGDDYPVLIAPGQPELRVNTDPEEIVRYSPTKMDIIDLDSNSFTTVRIRDFLAEFGDEIPGIEQLVSVYNDGVLSRKSRLTLDPTADNVVVTFDGLFADTDFVATIKDMIDVLGSELETTVDIEFAYDGSKIWLLQCRPQSRSSETAPAPIPKNVPESDVIFTANRHISNGSVPEITHIVYIDARRYRELSSADAMRRVAQLVGRLNKILPKRRFILMGPGRWGSRGEVGMGVGVTYSDISNTSALIEVAMRSGEYLPDVSFGTHFFQDLVEASIRYVPLYPDDADVTFNERFLTRTRNELAELLPEYADLEDVVRVIDVPKAGNGRILRVLLNAELDEGLAMLDTPSRAAPPGPRPPRIDEKQTTPDDDSHWQWRADMAERIARNLDADRFGVNAMYILGSALNGTAGPASDIDLIVHHVGDEAKLAELKTWLDAWSRCLAELNYLKTGYRVDGLLDLHYLTDEDIEKRTSFAVKINAVTDPAEPLPVERKSEPGSTSP